MSANSNKEMKPLDGIRVLDLSRILAGPWAGQVLADLGAEVIKVERPEHGDDTRKWGPPYLKDVDGNETAESAYYLSANRGKQSIEIDITSPAGIEQTIELIKEADVLIENFKVGSLQNYGLDYASVSQVNPRLVYCSITGCGQTGSRAEQAGYDLMIQAQSGLMSITGESAAHGGQPTKVGVAITDIATGLYSVIAIQAALIERQTSGVGKHIDMALLDCATALLANQASNYLVGREVPQRLGNEHPNIVPYQSFPTADGYIIVAVGNDQQFERFCRALDNPGWAKDKRFIANQSRVKHRAEITQLITEVLMTRGCTLWLELFESENIPAAPINDLDQAFEDLHLRSRDMIQDYQHSHGVTVQAVGSPIKFVGEGKKKVAPPPTLGWSNSKET
jgi:crotonobetainyl-CoA:carnitine CoA-transferase CaiB-like acyl-CoA transferase